MKTTDRLFLFGLVLLVVLAGMWSMHDFSKNRNLNWINVVWEAKAVFPADTITVNVHFIATGEKTLIGGLVEEKISTLKAMLSWSEINKEVWNQLNYYFQRNCYFQDESLNIPCADVRFSFTLTWEDMEAKLIAFSSQIEKIPYTEIGGYNFMVSKETTAYQDLRAKALQDAEKKAQQVADVLGVKLGKLIVYSDNNPITIPNDYQESSNVVYVNAPLFLNNGTLTVELPIKVYQTYAIK